MGPQIGATETNVAVGANLGNDCKLFMQLSSIFKENLLIQCSIDDLVVGVLLSQRLFLHGIINTMESSLMIAVVDGNRILGANNRRINHQLRCF